MKLVALGAVGVLAFAACGDDDDDDTPEVTIAPVTESVAPAETTPVVTIAGEGTVPAVPVVTVEPEG